VTGWFVAFIVQLSMIPFVADSANARLALNKC